jgi:hypothetical protein
VKIDLLGPMGSGERDDRARRVCLPASASEYDLPLLKYGQIPAFHVGGDWRFFIEAMAIPLHREPSAANRNSYTWRNVLG